MPLIASTTFLRLIDGVAIVLAQALQLAQARVASTWTGVTPAGLRAINLYPQGLTRGAA